MSEIKVVICEDEVLIAEHLRLIVESFGYNVVHVARNVKSSLKAIADHRPNLVLLDIRMEGPFDGIEIGRHLMDNYNIPFLFISATSEKRMVDRALKVKPSGYIVKPFEAMEIYSAIQIALNRNLQNERNNFIVLKDGYTDIKLLHNQIKYIKCDNIYLEIYTATKKIVIRRTLESFVEELQNENFIRCHRSFCVNKIQVDLVDSNYLLIDEIKIPVSRKYQTSVREIFKH